MMVVTVGFEHWPVATMFVHDGIGNVMFVAHWTIFTQLVHD